MKMIALSSFFSLARFFTANGVVLVSLSFKANALTVYIDFGSTLGSIPSSYSAAAATPGVWNEVPVSGITDLVDITGADSGWSLTFASNYGDGVWASGLPGPYSMLLYDNFYARSGELWSFSNTGLSDGLYDVYYYAPGHDAVSTGDFTVEGVSAVNLLGDPTRRARRRNFMGKAGRDFRV